MMDTPIWLAVLCALDVIEQFESAELRRSRVVAQELGVSHSDACAHLTLLLRRKYVARTKERVTDPETKNTSFIYRLSPRGRRAMKEALEMN